MSFFSNFIDDIKDEVEDLVKKEITKRTGLKLGGSSRRAASWQTRNEKRHKFMY